MNKSIYFSSGQKEPFAFLLDDQYVFDLLDIGYTLSPEGIDLGDVKPKTSYVDIEGADGRIDVTNALTEDVKFDNREVRVPIQSVAYSSTDNLSDRFILDQLFSGKERKMYVDDWYMEGRFALESSYSYPVRSYTIIGDCKPYRYNADESSKTFEVADTLECSIDYADTMPVCPTINVSSDMELTLYGSVYSLKKGDNIVPDLILRNGVTEFKLTGSGTAVVTWRGGNL